MFVIMNPLTKYLRGNREQIVESALTIAVPRAFSTAPLPAECHQQLKQRNQFPEQLKE